MIFNINTQNFSSLKVNWRNLNRTLQIVGMFSLITKGVNMSLYNFFYMFERQEKKDFNTQF